MITIIAMFETKPECAEAFHKLAVPCVEASSKEEGNVSYGLYAGKENASKFFFVECWKDEEAIATHNASAHFQSCANAFMPLLAKAPIIEQAVALG